MQAEMRPQRKKPTLQEMHEAAFGKKRKSEKRDFINLHDEHDDDDADCYVD